MARMAMSRCALITSGIALLLVIAGLFLLLFNVQILRSIASKQLMLKNGSEAFDKWHNPPVPYTLKVYFFNINNAKEFAAGSETLDLTEVGPFVYQEQKIKNIHQLEENTIDYMPQSSFVFNQTLSGELTEDMPITTINVPLVSIIGAALRNHKRKPLFYNFIQAALKKIGPQKLIVTRTVRELAFQGYKDPIFTQVREMMKMMNDPRMTPPPVFGLLYEKNMTDMQGNWTIGTGSDSPKNIARLFKWNHNETINMWAKGSTCDQVRGTDGSQFGPDVNEEQKLNLFIGDFCRSVPLTFAGNSQLYGIKTLRFKINSLNKVDSEEDKCYCIYDECFGEGVLDVGPCQRDAPFAVTKPHFLGAEHLIKKDKGLNPDPAKHDSYLDVEPWTGMSLAASMRFQVNIETRPENTLAKITFPKKILPLLWIEETASADQKSADQLNSRLFSKITIFRLFAASMVILGVVLVVVYFVIKILRNRKNTVVFITSN